MEISQTLPNQQPSIPDPRQRPLRVDPSHPLPTSVPPIRKMETSPLHGQAGPSNGLGRNTSRRRKPTGSGHGQYESFPKPEAPEVPKAPPVSYREPYGQNPSNTSHRTNPTSFAARAGVSSGDGVILPDSPIEDSFESMAETARQNRRGSIRRSSAAKKPDFNDQNAEPSAPPADVITPSYSHADTTHSRQAQKRDQTTSRRRSDTSANQPDPAIRFSPSRSNSKRGTPGVVDPRKEWAVDRSPLQKLEGKLNDISKEEKRARVEEAEQLLRERTIGGGRDRRKSGADATASRTTSRRESGDGRRRSSVRHDERHNTIENPPGLGDPQDLQDDSRRQYAEEVLPSARRQEQPRTTGQRVKPKSNTIPMDTGEYTQPDLVKGGSRRGETQSNGTRQPGQAQEYQVEDDPDYHGSTPVVGNSPEEDLDSQFEQSKVKPGKGDVRFAQHERSMRSSRPNKQVLKQQQELYSSKAQPSDGNDSVTQHGGTAYPNSRKTVENRDPPVKYEIPPQTANGIAARQKVGFGGEPTLVEAAPTHQHHRLSRLLHRGRNADSISGGDVETQPRHLDEWRQAGTARLVAADFGRVSGASTKSTPSWEKGQSRNRATSDAIDVGSSGEDGLSGASFDPPLYLKCGPMLRFTGLQRSELQPTGNYRDSSIAEREVWRGSIMIVTTDAQSDYAHPPTLELFPEPMELLPPPPQQVNVESGHSLPSAYIDPVAGLPKLTRQGGVVYVKPVEDLDPEKDLSRIESDEGLFERTRTANVPTTYGKPITSQSTTGQSSGSGSSRRRSRSKASRSQVQGVRLHAERGVTFWRFNVEVELTEKQERIGYRINQSASVGFWVPAKGQTMNVMFHSCNGFSMSVNPDMFSGPDPLWRDVLNNHQTRPFHVMVGGGDQIYNDKVMNETELFQDWLGIKNPHHKHEAPFSVEMRDELETFYLNRYSMWFSQGLFGMANSQIPMVNVWDDHDIIDGFGSYPHRFMSTPVFCGLGAVAFKYYMLFQHQSVVDEGPAEEPSWLMGAAPGPYINELSRSLFMFFGKSVAFLGLDCRTERMRDEILSEATYTLVFDRCRREIVQGETKHLIVLLGVPIAYPRLNFLENLLTSRVMDPIKALGRAGLLGGFINKFDGGVEILDDLDDHWTARHHKQERNWFIEELQELAAEKSIRVTILGGDVHLAAIGQFYSSPQLNIPKDRDHRYMPNVISSAIVNTPPPELMADILNKRDKKHYVEKEHKETLEDMIPMFTHDVDGKNRNNKRLLPRRNWCSIREYHPGSTPPPTPPESESGSMDEESPPAPPTRLQRTLSLTRDDVKPGNLIRRLSGRARPPSPDYPPSNEYRGSPPTPPEEDYFLQQPKRASSQPAPNHGSTLRHSSAPLPRPGNFQRRPTNLSEKAVLKGGADANEEQASGHIDLEHGLDICINCEVSQKDPAGITVPYRLLVPVLRYQGPEDRNATEYRKKGVIERFRSISLGRNRKSGLASRQGQGEWGGSSDGYTPSVSEAGEQPPQARQRPVIGQPMPVQQAHGGYQGRRLSKAGRMLGTGNNESGSDRYQNPAGRTNRANGSAGPRTGVEPFQPRPSSEDNGVIIGAGEKISSAGTRDSRYQNGPNEGVVLGQGAKVSSAGTRGTGPQGLQTGNGTVKMGFGDRVRSAGAAMSGGLQSHPGTTGNGSQGQRIISSGPKKGVRYLDDDEEGEQMGQDESEDDYEPRNQAPVGAGQGSGRGYGGIEAYKEKSWRRFF